MPPPPPPAPPPPPPPPPGFSTSPVGSQGARNGLGTAALVLGILSIFAIITVVGGVILGLIGVILGLVGRGRVKRGEADNGGVALAGIVTGLVGLLVSIILIVVGVIFFADDFTDLVDCLDEAGDNPAAVEQCERDFEDDLTGG